MRGAAALAVTLVLTSGAAAGEQGVPGALDAGEPGRVARVVDGDTVHLADGREIRLVGIDAPELNPGHETLPPEPHARAARRALRELVGGARVRPRFAPDAPRRDRYGRWLAHLAAPDGTWVQGALLRGGHARAYILRHGRPLAPRMLALERRARRANRGLWTRQAYRVRTPAETHDAVGSWRIAEGRVRDAAVVDGRLYLNFGADWRTDFTITVPPEARERFARAGLTRERLDGARVRGRGWLEAYNGPQMELTVPANLTPVDP